MEGHGDVEQDRGDPEVEASAAGHRLDGGEAAEGLGAGVEVDGELLEGLAACGRDEVVVCGFTVATGERDLAGPRVAFARPALHQEDLGIGLPTERDRDGSLAGSLWGRNRGLLGEPRGELLRWGKGHVGVGLAMGAARGR